MPPGLDVAVVERPEEFVRLEAEWDDLHRCARETTPFQSWAWMYTWWEAYGAGHELRLVTLRDDGLLVGLVPLVLTRRRGVATLLFLGTRRNDYQDVLARVGWEDRVAAAVRPALRQLHGWHVADLHQLRPGTVGWQSVHRREGLRMCVQHAGSPVIKVRAWDELVASVSRNQRSTVRRTIRRADDDGLRAELVEPEAAGQAAARLVTLHRELWQGRNMTPEHATPRWATFIESAARRTVAGGLGAISEFRLDGEVVLSVFWLIGPDFVAFYQAGVGRKALGRYQWNALLVRAGIELARSRGLEHLDLLRGEQDYKLQWASQVVPSLRVLLGRNPVIWGLYAAAVVGRARLEGFVFSQRCPPWVRDAARRANRVVRPSH